MPLFSKNGKTILFVHIPKTGGTSIYYFFKENTFTVDWFNSSYDIINKESSPQHRHREKIIEFLNKKPFAYDYSFTIVRNPLDRLISEYFQQCRNEDALSKKLTSKDFSFWVDQVFKKHKQNPIFFDNHIRPQVDFLLDDSVVFRFENGYEDFLGALRELDRLYDFDIDFKKFSHYKKGTNRVPIDIPRETLDKISKFYEKDYAKFYPFAHVPFC